MLDKFMFNHSVRRLIGLFGPSQFYLERQRWRINCPYKYVNRFSKCPNCKFYTTLNDYIL